MKQNTQVSSLSQGTVLVTHTVPAGVCLLGVFCYIVLVGKHHCEIKLMAVNI